jgi:hypothetical protein
MRRAFNVLYYQNSLPFTPYSETAPIDGNLWAEQSVVLLEKFQYTSINTINITNIYTATTTTTTNNFNFQFQFKFFIIYVLSQQL